MDRRIVRGSVWGRARTPGFGRLAAGLLAPAVLVGCLPLPMYRMEQLTPRVVGTLHRDDGQPIAGAVVNLSNAPDDRTCSALPASDTTDAAGRFELPAITERRRAFFLLLPIDRTSTARFHVCVRPADSPTATTKVLRTTVFASVTGDSVRCLQRDGGDVRHLTCESRYSYASSAMYSWSPHFIVEGGRWSDGASSGYYRLLLDDADDYGNASRLAVQWIDSSGVRATVESPTRETVRPWPAPKLVHRDGRWYATSIAVKPTKWANDRQLAVELGPPGTARLLADSTRDRVFR
jgi:hypothetical protein